MFHPQGKTTRLLIIGGLAAGMSAAAEARRTDPAIQITVVERGPLVTYAKCSLPFFIAGEAESPLQAVRYDPAYFRRERNIDVRVHCEALYIDRHDGSVRVRDLDRGGEFSLPFDRLIIATGTNTRLPCGWCEDTCPENVFGLNSAMDAIRLDQWIHSHSTGQAAVIGGGVLGVEMAWALKRRGLKVVLVEKGSRLFGDVSLAMDERIRQELEEQGIYVFTGMDVQAASGPWPLRSITVSGLEIPCDLVIAATGFKPDLKLAESAGISPGSLGGIPVNERLRTAVNPIWACGDCAEFRCGITKRPVFNRIGPTAIRSGYLAGLGAAGAMVRMEGILNPQLAKVYSRYHASAGLGPAAAAQWLGPDFAQVELDSRELPGYIKQSATESRSELYFSRRTGKIVGTQILGQRNLKRLDMLVIAMQEGIPVDRLARMDFSYTPDYNTAGDPVAVLARKAEVFRR